VFKVFNFCLNVDSGIHLSYLHGPHACTTPILLTYIRLRHRWSLYLIFRRDYGTIIVNVARSDANAAMEMCSERQNGFKRIDKNE